MTYPRSKHVALLDTPTPLSQYGCLLTDTDFVYHSSITQRDVTCYEGD